MVIGVNAKNKKGASVHVTYLIHIQDIKPWPPSQSLRSLRSVLIQWENGGRNSGSTDAVVPSIGSIVGEGKIEFNESFRLPVTLVRETSGRGKDGDSFQKNCLEFNLCEPRRDKIQLLANAVIDLADYGVVKEAITVSAPMNSNRSFRNTSQPILYIKIQPVDKGRTSSSSSSDNLLKVSQDKNGGESVSAFMNEKYAEEAEVASLTDDDGSSHSSITNGGLRPQNEENGPARFTESKGGINGEQAFASGLGIEKHIASQENLKEISSCSSSVDLSSDIGSPVNARTSVLDSPDSSSMSMPKTDISDSVHSSSLVFNNESKEKEASTNMKNNGHHDFAQEVDEEVINDSLKLRGDMNQMRAVQNTTNNDVCNSSIGVANGQNLEEKRHFREDEPLDAFPQDGTRNEDSFGTDTVSSSGSFEMKGNTLKIDRLKHVKSVRSSSDSTRVNGSVSRNHHDELKEVGALADVENSAGSLKVNEWKNAKVYPQDARTSILNGKIQQLEHKIKMLEGELREAAGIEVALYSVVAEHGSSMSKVHAPARRLSRLYLHAYRESSQPRRGSAAKSAVSGLVLVAKACGNDVPRLTFWLSNSVVLRAIISQATSDKEPSSAGQRMERNGGGKGNKMTSSILKWRESPSSRKENKSGIYGDLRDLDDPHAFMSALERVEAWIFSRIVESIWWQTLTPHMQSADMKAIDKLVGSGSKKSLGRTSSSCDQDQGNFSLELWKQAFKDACERLCPVRAGGHECGCLPMLARLIMEQCVARLDVAMFNAILRESADEIPTDPVSDPISDPKVLPIPAGKSSFGAGAQLKNAIGNWSMWLTDVFGMDDDLLEDDNDKDNNDDRQDTTFKSFHLLNALSDLMMLPKDMLLSRSIRKEVCPTFGAPLIKRVLDNFVPDEFCPDPIPDVVLEALESEDPLEVEESSVTTTPYIAAPPLYLPPLADSVAETFGESGNKLQLRRSVSLLRKMYTSDDELDELSSPLTLIFLDGSRPSPPALTKLSWKSKDMSKQNSIRYELLRDIWMNSE
ncbi:hypothetical protein JCGZ_10150 [Jatropha curcas]|uniref:C2 NT-type domain-containing protein n=1 Tax=Jatropha curcas TaxID=180498 RepID=A0A067LNA0_JATCU|nr:uncharacterized protein LOC105632845 [Jatropha curcas]KDP46310.1 hypothetical protein JCGZ_10150 [Jatropha curcas]